MVVRATLDPMRLTEPVRKAVTDVDRDQAITNIKPLDELKIDRSFITRAHERLDDVSIIMSTIELAHNMGLKVVAEGVETQEAWNLLRRLGCDLVQGYLVSRPLSVADTLAYLKQAKSTQPADETTNRQLRALKV